MANYFEFLSAIAITNKGLNGRKKREETEETSDSEVGSSLGQVVWKVLSLFLLFYHVYQLDHYFNIRKSWKIYQLAQRIVLVFAFLEMPFIYFFCLLFLPIWSAKSPSIKISPGYPENSYLSCMSGLFNSLAICKPFFLSSNFMECKHYLTHHIFRFLNWSMRTPCGRPLTWTRGVSTWWSHMLCQSPARGQGSKSVVRSLELFALVAAI